MPDPGPDSPRPGATPSPSLADLPGPRRLVLALFLGSILCAYGLAQLKLLTSVGVDGSFPGPDAVLARYHGDPSRTLLHKVLDASLPVDDAKRMYGFLGATDEERERARAKVMAWVAGGAVKAGWPTVAPIFTGDATCGGCHSTRPDAEGKPRPRADLPFDTYDQAVASTRTDTGMSIHDLTTSAHNHGFAFTVVTLLVGWIFTGTRWRGPLVALLVVGATVGAATDIGGWFLTKAHGAPFQHAVVLGGALFGASLLAMVVLSLDELVLGGALGRPVARALRALRLARREP